MARSKSSKNWLKEHFSDVFVKRAQKEGYRSRAAFKLLELDDKDKLLRPGMMVVDLGAAPGGWSQIAADKVGVKGHVFALDLLPMDNLENTTVIQGDFQSDDVYQQLLEKLDNRQVELVISDMAPNMSGNRAIDVPKSMYLVELAMDFASQALKKGGVFVTKIFQGEGFDECLLALRQCYSKVVIRKPEASRGRSTEVYIVAKGFKA